MKTRMTNILKTLAVLAAFSFGVAHAQEMGWLQTGYGTFSYFDTANWLNGEVNGVFGTNMTSKATQSIIFASDFTATSNMFAFAHPGEVTFVFRGDTTDVTASLQGDLTIEPSSTKGSVTFGSVTAGQAMNFNLGGGTRTIDTKLPLYFYNTLDNGTVVKTGSGSLYLVRDGRAPNIAVHVKKGALCFDSSTTSVTGCVRAASVSVHAGELVVKGNSGTDSVDTVTGNLTIDGAENGGSSFVTVDAGSKNAKLHAQALIRANGGVAVLRGDSLGDSPGAGIGNFFVDTTPELIGGNGSEGPTSLSVVPGFIGSRSISGGGNASYDQTFVTYEAGRGFRPLIFATEYTNAVDSGSVTWQNVCVPNATTWTLTSDTSINALILQSNYSNTSDTTVTGSGTLTVRSGMVILGYHGQKSPVIDVPLDFGVRQGVVVYAQGKNSYIKQTIRGSNGVVFCQATTTPSSGNLSVQSICDYSGDTYVLGFVSIADNSLPHGSRLGNIYAYTKLMINNTTMNGLNGTGDLNKPNSGSGTISIGDNDANGDFTGTITQFGTLSIIKIGNGTQRFGGACTYAGTTKVNGGTLVMDGTGISAITVNTNATLRGSGTITKSGTAITVSNGATLAPGGTNGVGTLTVLQGDVAFASGSALRVTADRLAGAGCLNVESNVTGSVTIPVTVSGDGASRWKIMQATSIAPEFVSTVKGVTVTKENGNTEVWVERAPKGTVVFLF